LQSFRHFFIIAPQIIEIVCTAQILEILQMILQKVVQMPIVLWMPTKSKGNANQQSTKLTEIKVRRQKYNSTPDRLPNRLRTPTSSLRQISVLVSVKPL
jgi:hypothetical protein